MMSPYQYAWGDPVSLTDPDGRCPACWGALIGGGVEFIAQVSANAALGKDPFDLDCYDIAQSTVTGALTGGLSVLTTSVKVARIAKISIAVTDELAKAGTDITLSDGEIVVNSVANGSKDATDAAAEAVVGLTTGALADGVGALAGDLVNTGLRSESRSATRQIRHTREGSANNQAAKNSLNQANSAMKVNQNKVNGVASVLIDVGKSPVENSVKQLFNQATGQNE